MTTELLHITTLGYHIYYSHHNNTMVYNVVMVMIPIVDQIFYTSACLILSFSVNGNQTKTAYFFLPPLLSRVEMCRV